MLDTLLTPSFRVRDLATTSTGIDNTPVGPALYNLQKLARVLEDIKSRIGSFTIASAYRSPAVNAAVGGSSTSRHMQGDGADIVPHYDTAEKFWAEILADRTISNSLGEISLKKHQNAIHLSLPYTNSYGSFVKASPRIADKESGSVVYRSISWDAAQSYLDKYGLSEVTETITDTAKKTVRLIQDNPVKFGVGVLVLGGGVLAISLASKRRK